LEYYIDRTAAVAVDADLLAVFLAEGEGAPADLDALVSGVASRAIAAGEFRGKLRDTLVLHNGGATGPRRIALVGIGKRDAADLETHRRAAAAAALAGRKHGAGSLALVMSTTTAASPADLTSALVEGAVLASYDYRDHKTGEAAVVRHPLVRLSLVAGEGMPQDALDQGLSLGRTLAEAGLWARDVGNTPGNQGTPTYLAERAQEIAAESGMKITVLDRADMEREGMGGILGVARGTEEPPKFIVLEHNGERTDLVTICLVGKGITFDTGGISLKPGADMHEMKFDKCGGVAVLATMRAVGRLKLPLRIIGIVPATENMPSGTAYKPGDVVRSMGGRTIEILNTDAEGRMILIDGITWAKRYSPSCIVDLATLTGACVVALGDQASGLFSTDESLAGELQCAAAGSGERVWRMPLYPEYTEQIRSDVADFKNTGGRSAGSCTAAALLQAHAEGTPWAHLDIAGTAWATREKDYIRKGATGVGPRTLVRWLQARARGK
jgi:leucyl aminopeptidase